MRKTLPLIGLAILSASIASLAGATESENVTDPITHPYQQSAYTSCASFAGGDCAIVFPAITTGRTLLLRASCTFSLAPGGKVEWTSVSQQGGSVSNALQIITYATVDGVTTYGINAETYLFYDTGQQPRIDVYTSGGAVQTLNCTLTGYYA